MDVLFDDVKATVFIFTVIFTRVRFSIADLGIMYMLDVICVFVAHLYVSMVCVQIFSIIV